MNINSKNTTSEKLLEIIGASPLVPESQLTPQTIMSACVILLCMSIMGKKNIEIDVSKLVFVGWETKLTVIE
ncbi:MAG: hypothetical protein QF466_00860 [Desulfobacterales bacterium]|jgi:hypothetical protein|nr:hypothetical protein [Desulfobacterales bacterium]MDP6681682.1 hypothetical protein [Desulfobacterales bacterium]MDP6807417.1 hypothetical protein [Desulfobacterales bacterium]|tara:strand:- start:55751 stop:55966 length:216 start_codon:yes stop_codon:yes gene_type:complete